MLAAFDLFGVRPIWYIGGQKKNTTSNGYMFSFGLLFFALWMLIILSHDLINRANPQVTKSTQQGVILESPIYIDLNEFQYMWGVLGDDSTLMYNTSIFTVHANVIYNNYTVQPLKMKNCTLSDIENIVPYEGTVYCLDEDKIYYDGVNAFIEVKFKACVNSTDNNNSCAPQEVINYRMSRSLFMIFFPVYSILPNNYLNPFQSKYNFVSYTIDTEKTKILNTLFKMAELQTDDGWLVSSVSSERQMIHDSVLFDIGAPDLYECMIDFQMWSMGDLDIVYRRFIKFQDFLAQAFGLIQFIILGLSIVFIPYARYKMYEYIGNQIYDLNIDFKKKKRRSTRIVQMQRTPVDPSEDFTSTDRRTKSVILPRQRVSLFSPAEFEPNSVDNDSITMRKAASGVINESSDFVHQMPQDYGDMSYGINNPQSDLSHATMISGGKTKEKPFYQGTLKTCLKKCKESSSAKNSKVKFSLSVCEYFLSFLRNSPKKILLERVENEIIRNLDILSFCKKMVEFELLKNYLLTENQQNLFSNLPRPKINLRIATEKKSFKYSDTPPHSFRIDSVLKSKEKEQEEINKIIENMQQQDMSSIDVKLLSRFRPLFKTSTTNIIEEDG